MTSPEKKQWPWLLAGLVGLLAAVLVIIVIAGKPGGSSKTVVVVTTTATRAAVPPAAASTGPISPGPTTGSAADVTISGCVSDAAQYPVAHLVITNHSSKTSNYLLTIEFDSQTGGDQYAQASAKLDNLAAGESRETDAESPKKVTQQYVCELASVTRYAS